MKKCLKKAAACILATSLAVTLGQVNSDNDNKISHAASSIKPAYEWTFENVDGENIASTGDNVGNAVLEGTANVKNEKVGYSGKDYLGTDNHVLSLEGGSKGSSFVQLPNDLYKGISSSTGLTWSFWLKPDASVSSYSRAFSSTDKSNKNEFAFTPYAADGVWNVIFDDNDSYKEIVGNEPVKGEWTLTTITISEKGVKVYENGALVETTCGGGDSSILKKRLDDVSKLVNNALGRTYSTWSDPDCKIKMDDVRLYNKELTEAEVKTTAEDYGIIVKKQEQTVVVDTDDGSKGLTELKKLTAKNPKGNIEVKLWKNGTGQLFYSAYMNGQVSLKCAPLGLVAKSVDLSKGLTIDEDSVQIKDGKEEYDWLQGSKRKVSKQYKEMSFDVTKASSKMTVIFRLFEDGIGYRYEVDGDTGKDNDVTDITSESSSFEFPNSALVWTTGTSATYEPSSYSRRKMANVIKNSFSAGPPILANMPNGNGECWVLLSEANVYNEENPYCASVFQTDSNKGAFKVKFGVYLTQEEDESLDGSKYSASYAQIDSVKMKDKFHTPWRVAIMTDNLEELTNSSLISDLNPPAKGDFSWVEPGTSSWSWWSTTSDAIDYDTLFDYIDYAQETGQKYCLVDYGWEIWKDYESKIKELVSYADKKGVGILLWYGVNKFDANHIFDLDSEDEIEKAFAWCEKMGVKGVKVDYINSDSQFAMKDMYNIASIAAKHKLVVNYHGCTDPNGENRTFPNILSSEAVMGSEYFKWSSGSPVGTLLTLPYTRNVIGSMEFTPVCMKVQKADTTNGFMLAMPVVYESAMQTLAHSCYVYPGYGGMSLLTDIPSSWDDSKLLAGSVPGESVIRARRSGDKWYLGAMSADEASYDVSLNFLDANVNYYAYIYSDKDDDSGIVMEKKVVTSKETLKLNLKKSGGCAIKFSKKDDLKKTKYENYMYYEAENASLGKETKVQGSAYVSNCQFVDNCKGAQNRLAFKYVDAPEDGIYEMKIYVVSNKGRDINVRVNKYESIPLKGLKGVYGDNNAVGCETVNIYLNKGRNQVYFYSNGTTMTPGIDRIAVSYYPVETGTAPNVTDDEPELYLTYHEEGSEPPMTVFPTPTPVPTQVPDPTLKPSQSPVPTATPVQNQSNNAKLGKVKTVSVKGNKKQVKVVFSKVKNAKKYQISYSTNSKMKKAKYVTTKKASYTIKKLKKNKKYFVRVRAISKSGSKTIYGAWSSIKKVKTR